MAHFSEVTDTIQLETILTDLYSNSKSNIKYNIHVVALDQLINVPLSLNLLVIVNYQTLKSGSMGTHWIGLINSQKLNDICIYDAYGIPDPPKQVLLFAKKLKDKYKKGLVANTTQAQPLTGLGSSSCGWFVLYFFHRVINYNESLNIVVNNIKTKDVIKYAKLLTRRYLSFNITKRNIKGYTKKRNSVWL